MPDNDLTETYSSKIHREIEHLSKLGKEKPLIAGFIVIVFVALAIVFYPHYFNSAPTSEDSPRSSPTPSVTEQNCSPQMIGVVTHSINLSCNNNKN